MDARRNIRLIIEYDGTGYVGWQRQKHGRSIQGEIESALSSIFQEPVKLYGAGRTDAGVHARGQVANFRTQSPIPPARIKGALNSYLPEDIVIRHAEDAPENFHARYSARERVYSYLITLERSALLKNYAWHVRFSLDPEPMDRAAALITGPHDFRAFCRANSGVEHHRCTVTRASWNRDGSTLRFSIAADRFLHGMVRLLVGTMIDLGRRRLALPQFVDLLEGRAGHSLVSAPAQGLVLEKILY